MSQNNNLPALIDKMEPEFNKALSGAIPSQRFTRIAKTAVMSNPQLMSADRTSLFSAITKAAQDQLVIDGREAALVMFGNKAQYMPMVAGLIKKMRQHPDFGSLTHGIIYENEFKTGAFRYVQGDNPELHHEPMVFGDRGEKIGAYAVLTTKQGDKFRAVMSADDILKRKAASRGGNSASSPWNGPFQEEMWVKTVIKKLYKIAPTSGDLMAALEGVFEEEVVDVAPVNEPETETPEPEVKETRAAAAVKAAAEEEIEEAEVIPADDDEIPM